MKTSHDLIPMDTKRRMLAIVTLSVLFILLLCLTILVNLLQSNTSTSTVSTPHGIENIVSE